MATKAGRSKKLRGAIDTRPNCEYDNCTNKADITASGWVPALCAQHYLDTHESYTRAKTKDSRGKG